MQDCLFCKIVRGEIPADIVFENDEVLAFKDINPQAPVHILVIPKKHYSTLNDMDDPSLFGKIYAAVDHITAELGLKEKGYRVVVNCGDEGGQVVYHVHFHILGGKKLSGQLG